MFIGHYGPAFAAKPAAPRVPLWILFVAVQWLDFCWAALVLMGVEKVRIVPGFTQGSALELYYMPYTHGLIGALVLSLLFGLVALAFVREKRAAALAVIAAAVFSHWLLDLLVHVPDLPMFGDADKVGFGLWRWLWISLPLELAFLLGGAVVYARAVPSRRRFGDLALWLFVAAMAAVEVYAAFGPAPTSAADEAKTALMAYALLALLAGLVDWGRGTVRA
ncbi:MAG: hypothetical protein JO261_07160 [Alphaproteobacteria bacterium]|nr:hypothetical protein [Alphaproteobacteria bacterium]MBV9693461.1 hypothetical protein [Alphaproteobacteria bacterium]